MLCINTYEQAYIDECRANVNAQVAAYRNMIKTVKAQAADGKAEAAIDTFESVFFNNLVLVLDNLFVHRSRTMEKKDGNPMNEVRLLSQSLMTNSSKLIADKSIKLNPAASILKVQAGDDIKLSEADFVRLAEAYFAEIERVYGEVAQPA
jgi:hypothetical protein